VVVFDEGVHLIVLIMIDEIKTATGEEEHN
jgi:hypothetical protein